MKKWGIAVLLPVALIVIIAAIVGIKTLTFSSRQLPVSSQVSYPIDKQLAAQRLAKAIQFKTVSYQDVSKIDYEEFTRLQDYMEKTYPLVHSTLEKKVINNYGLLYIWHGQDPQKKPYLLLAHQDVVPATDEGWTYPPFSGTIADGYVWGRGTFDDKSPMIAQMEAVEYLIRDGFKPSRSVYFAYGQDEEPQGPNGAVKIAEYLKAQGLEFEYINDEGDVIISNAVPGISSPVALIGIAENGVLYLELSTESEGGHAGTAPKQTTVAILAAAIDKLGQNPFPCHGTVKTFDFLGPEMSMPYKMIFANTWLFGPFIEAQLSKAASTDASQRTVIAPTMFQGSSQPTVLPPRSTAVVRFGIIPGETIDYVIQRVNTVINDPRVTVKLYSGYDNRGPSPMSDTETSAYKTFSKTIREVFPDVLTTPHVALVRTDSYRYNDLSSSIFRFAPYRLTIADLNRSHGFDERVSVDNYGEMISFFIQLIKNSDN